MGVESGLREGQLIGPPLKIRRHLQLPAMQLDGAANNFVATVRTVLDEHFLVDG
jgi:hypothetical protein